MASFDLILFLQVCSMTVSFALAFALGFSRFHQPDTSPAYEQLRWLLMGAMLIFTVHFILQMCFGFRAQGDDIGAVINILFYSPVTSVISYSIVRLGCGPGYRRSHIWASLISLVLIGATFVGGYIHYGSLHMPGVVHVMGLLFFCTVVYFAFYPHSEMNRVRRMVEEESGQEPVQYNLYLRTGSTLLIIISLWIPFAIFYTPMLAVVGPLFLLAVMFYVLSFMALGFNLRTIHPIIHEDVDIVADTDACGSDEECTDADVHQLSDEQTDMIRQSIEEWRQGKGYRAYDLNSVVLSVRLNIPKRLLIRYLREVEGKSFRVWLSDLRIEEAKRMLIEYPNYSNEAIAEACGFSRNHLQSRFKESTGLTPTEWREAQSR